MLDSGPRLGIPRSLSAIAASRSEPATGTASVESYGFSLSSASGSPPSGASGDADARAPEPMVLSVSTTCRRSAIVRSRSAARFRMAASACSVKSWVQGELSDSNLAVLGWESQPAGIPGRAFLRGHRTRKRNRRPTAPRSSVRRLGRSGSRSFSGRRGGARLADRGER